MNVELKLLSVLTEGGVHSGTAIGERLGVSRVAVKKRIDQLRKRGLPVDIVPGKGYRLSSGISLLSEPAILAALPRFVQEKLQSVEVHQSLPSTNRYLREAEPQKAGRAHAVLAESQPEGQGRRGRGWIATPYRNIMLSISWYCETWPNHPAGLSLAFAVAVHQVLSGYLPKDSADLKIKWPNDILLNGRKLAGLLVDASGEASGGCKLVFGVGINVVIADQDSTEIDQPWAQLQQPDSPALDRNLIAADVVSSLVEAICLYESQGFEPFRAYWNEQAAYVGRAVRLSNEQHTFDGVLKGVDETGALILETSSGERLSFTQADISLRPR